MTQHNHGIDREKISYLVLAGNFREFTIWKENNKIPVTAALYVSTPNVLYGISIPPDTRVVRVGTFNLRPDAQDILNVLWERVGTLSRPKDLPPNVGVVDYDNN